MTFAAWLKQPSEEWFAQNERALKERAETIARREAAEHAALRRSRVGAANLPLKARDVELLAQDSASLKETLALKAVREFVALNSDDTNTLALVGKVGTGKTFAASWAIAEKGGTYVKLDRLLELRLSWDRDEKREYARIRESRGIVVIDELGIELDRDRSPAVLCDVIDERRKSGCRTILVSNLSRQQIEERYGERTFNRLADMCVFQSCVGPSLRQSVRPV